MVNRIESIGDGLPVPFGPDATAGQASSHTMEAPLPPDIDEECKVQSVAMAIESRQGLPTSKEVLTAIAAGFYLRMTGTLKKVFQNRSSTDPKTAA